MAIPAALFVRKYSYKKGILLGLTLYAIGALLFYPAARFEVFSFFLGSLYILTFGLAFLETTANPYILSMGDEKTATQRLNLAQAFNPIGSLFGMFVASKFILVALDSDKRNEAGQLTFKTLDEAQKAIIRTHDLSIIRDPYVILGFVVIAMLVIIGVTKMPKRKKTKSYSSAGHL
jgi:FHS family L-fucose permease-like MFS transporter